MPFGSGAALPFDSPEVNLVVGMRYTFILSGQAHPAYRSPTIPTDPTFGTLHWSVFPEAPYTTGSGNASVVFHNASPYLDSLAPSVAFGYFDPAQSVGEPVGSLKLGAQTAVVALPPARLSPSAVGFYAIDPVSGFTVLPSAFDPIDAGNRLPLNAEQNLSLYAVDSPAASSDASPAPTGTQPPKVEWIGVFDNNG